MEFTATTRLEIQQTYKLLQLVRSGDFEAIQQFLREGIPYLINYGDPQEGETALHLASFEDKEKMVQFLLALDANPNVRDFKGRTPLMRAAEQGHFRTVEILAKNLSDPKIKDAAGGDVLTHCMSQSTKRHLRCLDIVLSFGACADTTAESDMPSLVFGCENSVENETMILMIMEKGGNANVFDKETGRTALSAACASGSELVVRSLCQHGANPNIADKRGKTSYHHAAQNGHIKAITTIAAYGADPTAIDKVGNSPIHFGAQSGVGLVCQFLYQRGCDPTIKNNKGYTASASAKERGIKGAMKLLKKCEKGFKKLQKPGFVNPYPYPLVHLYDWIHERQEAVKETMMKRVILPEDLNSSELKGNFLWVSDVEDVFSVMQTPFPAEFGTKFMNAHDHGRRGVVEIDDMISGKKYLNKQYLMVSYEPKKKKGKGGKKGGKKAGKAGKGKASWPMPICMEEEQERRPDGGPPAQYVEKQVLITDCTRFNRDEKPKHEYEDDSKWYLQQPEKQFIGITEAAKVGDMNTIKDALENGGTFVDTRDKFYKTALMVAAAEGNIDLVDYLLAHGASVTAKDNFKWTPLHHACHSGQVDVVHTLLLAGADGNAQTWNGATPLMRAVQSGKIEVVRFLLECNVNVTKINKKEKSAVDVAEEWAGATIYNLIKAKYDATPKPKPDKNGVSQPAANKPLTIPPMEVLRPAVRAFKSESFYRQIKEDSKVKEKDLTAAAKLRNQSRMDLVLSTIPDNHEPASNNQNSAWSRQPDTKELLKQNMDKRERYGDEIDFETYQKPLKSNIEKVIVKSQT